MVTLDGASVPHGGADGWELSAAAHELTFRGEACTGRDWATRSSRSTPCDAVEKL